MKTPAAVFFFIFLSTAAFGQCGEMALGLNGSAIAPQMGKTGLGSNISFIYNISGQFTIHHGVGILGWGDDPYNASRLFIYSMSARYYLPISYIRPYLSAELDYAIGKFRDIYESADFPSDKVPRYKNEKTINEFLSGLGAGIIYPITEFLSLDVNYLLILTARTNELDHMRGSIGVLYRI